MHVSASQLTPNLDDSSIMCAIKQRTQSFMSWSRLCQKALRFTNASVQTCPSAKFKKTCPKSTVKSYSNVIPAHDLHDALRDQWFQRSLWPGAQFTLLYVVWTAVPAPRSVPWWEMCWNSTMILWHTMTYYDIMICLKLSHVGMSMCLSSLTSWWTSVKSTCQKRSEHAGLLVIPPRDSVYIG